MPLFQDILQLFALINEKPDILIVDFSEHNKINTSFKCHDSRDQLFGPINRE